MTYRVDILPQASKSLAKLGSDLGERIYRALKELAKNPRPAGVKKMSGKEAWRIRVGDYRVIYEIHDGLLLILVIEIGHRRDIYRSL